MEHSSLKCRFGYTTDIFRHFSDYLNEIILIQTFFSVFTLGLIFVCIFVLKFSTTLFVFEHISHR